MADLSKITINYSMIPNFVNLDHAKFGLHKWNSEQSNLQQFKV